MLHMCCNLCKMDVIMRSKDVLHFSTVIVNAIVSPVRVGRTPANFQSIHVHTLSEWGWIEKFDHHQKEWSPLPLGGTPWGFEALAKYVPLFNQHVVEVVGDWMLTNLDNILFSVTASRKSSSTPPPITELAFITSCWACSRLSPSLFVPSTQQHRRSRWLP